MNARLILMALMLVLALLAQAQERTLARLLTQGSTMPRGTT